MKQLTLEPFKSDSDGDVAFHNLSGKTSRSSIVYAHVVESPAPVTNRLTTLQSSFAHLPQHFPHDSVFLYSLDDLENGCQLGQSSDMPSMTATVAMRNGRHRGFRGRPALKSFSVPRGSSKVKAADGAATLNSSTSDCCPSIHNTNNATKFQPVIGLYGRTKGHDCIKCLSRSQTKTIFRGSSSLTCKASSQSCSDGLVHSRACDAYRFRFQKSVTKMSPNDYQLANFLSPRNAKANHEIRTNDVKRTDKGCNNREAAYLHTVCLPKRGTMKLTASAFERDYPLVNPERGKYARQREDNRVKETSFGTDSPQSSHSHRGLLIRNKSMLHLMPEYHIQDIYKHKFHGTNTNNHMTDSLRWNEGWSQNPDYHTINSIHEILSECRSLPWWHKSSLSEVASQRVAIIEVDSQKQNTVNSSSEETAAALLPKSDSTSNEFNLREILVGADKIHLSHVKDRFKTGSFVLPVLNTVYSTGIVEH